MALLFQIYIKDKMITWIYTLKQVDPGNENVTSTAYREMQYEIFIQILGVATIFNCTSPINVRVSPYTVL